jgi:hypothetical protein
MRRQDERNVKARARAARNRFNVYDGSDTDSLETGCHRTGSALPGGETARLGSATVTATGPGSATMTSITFDTLAYVKTLREAGFEERQAEAQASALASVLKSGVGELATKEDLNRLESKLESRLNLFEERSEGRFKLLQWMLAFNLAISIALLWILIRTATQ